MLVYGDLEREEDAASVAVEVERRLSHCGGLGPGLTRHQELVAAFIRASELVQGVLDGSFRRTGSDDVGPLQQAGTGLLRVLADAIAVSLDSDFSSYSCPGWGEHLALLSAEGSIVTRQAEGYAFYGLYPEAYLVAARRSGLNARTTVIGLRSIGTGLAAMVASGLDAATVLTLRPSGHPFDRRLVLSDGLAARLCAGTGAFAIVDEGPGLSGSSLNCVADWLVAHGVSERRIHFFPSNGGGLGTAARADHRQRWSAARKHVVDFDSLFLRPAHPAHRLEHWISGDVGPVQNGLVDLSGGAWRSLRSARATVPADPAMERRKYLASTDQGRWIAKFVGIGAEGEAKLALARTLAEAGFTPAPAGLRHGFLISPWIEDESAAHETVLATHLADYLTFRAGLPPDRPGAQLEQLFTMAAYNLGQVFGQEAESAVRLALGDATRFQPIACCTDNRLHAWEWIRTESRWLKLDALDHHAAHDLVGCQDIAWDIAGAAVELELSGDDRDQLADTVSARTGRSLPRDFVSAYALCYLGFQLGLWSLAYERASADDRGPIQRQLRRYIGTTPCARLPWSVSGVSYDAKVWRSARPLQLPQGSFRL